MGAFAPQPLDVRCSQAVAADAYDLAELLPHASVDCIVTSPPYWGQRSYGLLHDESVLARWRDAGGDDEETPPYAWYREHGGVLGMEPHPLWYVDHLAEVFTRLRAALRPSASVWVNLGDTYFARWSSIREAGRQGLGEERERTRRRTPSGGFRHDKQLLMLPARFAIAMQEEGWILRNDLIWSKPNVPPRPELDRLRLAHEHLFHFVQRTPGRRPTYYYDLGGAEPGARDVVSVRTASVRDGHSATAPQALLAPRIASSCPPDGVVLDPFCGGGGTLEAAVDLGRVAIGADVQPAYAESAARRVAWAVRGERRRAAG